jgi:hypothetical protein
MKKHRNVRQVLFVLFFLTMVTCPGGIGCRGARLPAGGWGCRAVRPPGGLPVVAKLRPAVKIPVPEPIPPFKPPVWVPPVKGPKLPEVGQGFAPRGPAADVVGLQRLAKPGDWTAPPAIRPAQPAPLATLQENVGARDWRSVRILSLEEAARPHATAEVTALRGLGEQSGQLEALETLGRAAGGDWPKVPAAEVLEAELAKLPEGLRAEVRKYLVSRARLEGNSGLARELQRGGEPPDAPTILRDLTALAAEPPVTPPPAQNASRLNLGPEGPQISLRPGVREELGKGLPELELAKLPKVELAARIQVRAKIEGAGHQAWDHLNVHLNHLKKHHAPQLQPRRNENKDAGALVFRADNVLNQLDPINQFGKRHKLYVVQMEAGKEYQIDLVTRTNGYDPYLYLFENSTPPRLVAEDDDSGGFPNARIVYKAAHSGAYQIHATYFGGLPNAARFTLTVRRLSKGI